MFWYIRQLLNYSCLPMLMTREAAVESISIVMQSSSIEHHNICEWLGGLYQYFLKCTRQEVMTASLSRLFYFYFFHHFFYFYFRWSIVLGDPA